MKRLAIVCSIVLSGCEVPPSEYIFKPNATVAQKDKDDFNCDLRAAQAVPSNMQVGITPTYTTPLTTSCYGGSNSVNCTTTGGQVYGGDVYSYDANSSLRSEYWAQCMIDKGYSGVDLPTCSPKQMPENAAQLLTGKLRVPKEGACQVQITERSTNILYAEELNDKGAQ